MTHTTVRMTLKLPCSPLEAKTEHEASLQSLQVQLQGKAKYP